RSWSGAGPRLMYRAFAHGALCDIPDEFPGTALHRLLAADPSSLPYPEKTTLIAPYNVGNGSGNEWRNREESWESGDRRHENEMSRVERGRVNGCAPRAGTTKTSTREQLVLMDTAPLIRPHKSRATREDCLHPKECTRSIPSGRSGPRRPGSGRPRSGRPC